MEYPNMKKWILGFGVWALVGMVAAQPADSLEAESVLEEALRHVRAADYSQAARMLLRAAELFDQLPQDASQRQALAYLYLADTYRRTGAIGEALLYYHRAEALFLKQPEPPARWLGFVYNGLGSCQRQVGDFEQSLRSYARAREYLTRHYHERHRLVGYNLSNTANTYDMMGQRRTALQFYERARKVLLAEMAQDDPRLGVLYLNLADTYFKLEQHDSTLHWARLAERCFADEPRGPRTGATFQVIAETYARQGRSEAAQSYFRKALYAVGLDSLDTHLFHQVNSAEDLLRILQAYGKFESQRADPKNPLPHLKAADRVFNFAAQFLEFAQSGLRESLSKELLLEVSNELFEAALWNCWQLYEWTQEEAYLQKAFTYAEQSDNALLREVVLKANAEAYAGVPDSLLEVERRLRSQVTEWENRLASEEEKEQPDSLLLRTCRDSIFAAKEAFQQLMLYLESSFPNYYSLKYASFHSDILPIQQKLKSEGKNLLKYFVGQDHLFLFLLTPERLHLLHRPKLFPLEAWVEDLRNSIVRFHPLNPNLPLNEQKYANIAWALYQELWQPIEPMLTSRKVLIIPGGILGYLPFECLLRAEPERPGAYESYPYLLKEYQLSYHNSANLYGHPPTRQGKGGGKEALVMAPAFTEEQAERNSEARLLFPPLHFNQEEAIEVHRLLGGARFLGKEATRAAFLRVSPRYDILHLATHSRVDDRSSQRSFLAFAPTDTSSPYERLFAADIYNLALDAELVTLSACATAYGNLLTGEGIASLARSFFFAGAHALLTTLWSVDDRSTLQITTNFYRHLEKGQPKSQALRQAKLQYLQNNPDWKAHPRFWAAFVLIGEDKPLYPKPLPAWGWALSAALVLLFGYGLARRRKNRLKVES